MSFAITPLGQVDPPEPPKPRIFSEPFRHSIVDSNYQPEQSLLSMVEGVPVRCEYYRQFLNVDEEPASFGKDNAPTFQSYTRIKDVIIKQEGGGVFNFDPAVGTSGRNYQGWISFDVTPIIHDVFIVDVGDGRAGLLTIIEQPEIRNFTANKVYFITYQMTGFLDEDTYNKLNSKVVEERQYSKDSSLSGGLSVVTTEDFTISGKLFAWRTTIANNIMRNFFWEPERTIAFEAFPGQMIYDPYLVNFIIAVMPPDLRNVYPFISQFSTEYGGREFGRHGDLNVWEVLLRGDFNLLPACDNKAAYIGVNRIVGTRTYGNISSSKFHAFVATDPERYKLYNAFYNWDGFPILRPSPETPVSYLFSEAFYKGGWNGPFEKIVVETLRHKVLDRKGLLEYCEGYFSLTKKEQLYHGAILLLLTQISRRIGDTL